MMLDKIIFFLFFRKILNSLWTEQQCISCLKFNYKTEGECTCSSCSSKSFKHICTEDECYLCKIFEYNLVFDCYCKKCYPEEEKKDEENKKVILWLL